MQRYFVSGTVKDLVFSEQDAFHIQKVMRLSRGDEIEVVLDSKVYLAVIDSSSPLKVHIQEEKKEDSELSSHVRLFFPLCKSDKSELVIQKATELGVGSIYFYRAKRSVVKLDNADFNKKLSRYLAIAKEASEQCHRQIIPEIKGVYDIKDIKNELCDLNLLAYELEAGQTNKLEELLNNSRGSISLIVGPEGGFDVKELEELVNMGFHKISLGRRILRVETAAIYGLSVIAFSLEK